MSVSATLRECAMITDVSRGGRCCAVAAPGSRPRERERDWNGIATKTNEAEVKIHRRAMPPKKTIDKKAKKSPSKAVEKAPILSKGEASSAEGGCVVKIEACKS